MVRPTAVGGVRPDEASERADQARGVALFRYELIREAADPTHSTRQRGRMVRELAARTPSRPRPGDRCGCRGRRWTAGSVTGGAEGSTHPCRANVHEVGDLAWPVVVGEPSIRVVTDDPPNNESSSASPTRSWTSPGGFLVVMRKPSKGCHDQPANGHGRIRLLITSPCMYAYPDR